MCIYEQCSMKGEAQYDEPFHDATQRRCCINYHDLTVEPPNKGHFGSRAFVLFSEVVLWWEVRANMQFIAPSRPNIPR